jgi:hypothetical protein
LISRIGSMPPYERGAGANGVNLESAKRAPLYWPNPRQKEEEFHAPVFS